MDVLGGKVGSTKERTEKSRSNLISGLKGKVLEWKEFPRKPRVKRILYKQGESGPRVSEEIDTKGEP